MFFLILNASTVSAQISPFSPGIRENSMGGLGLAESRYWKTFYNPALLGNSSSFLWSAALSHQKPFLHTGMSNQGANLQLQWKNKGLGLGLLLSEVPGIQRWTYQLAYGQKLMPKVLVGLGYGFNLWFVPSENSSLLFSNFNFSLSYDWRKDVNFQLAINGRHHSNESSENITSSVRLSWGLSWQLTDKSLLGIEYSESSDQLNLWRLGYRHRLNERLSWRLGLKGLPLSFGWSLCFEWKKLDCVIGGQWSPNWPAGLGMEWDYQNVLD